MTREEKLYSMSGLTLIQLADKLGVKVNANKTRTGLKEAKSKVIEKILAAEAALEEPKVEEPIVEEQQPANTLVETPAPAELPKVTIVKDEPIDEEDEVEPFIYTDSDGTEWEDYEIGKKIKKWPAEKKAEFRQYYEDAFINNEIEVDEAEMLREWSAVYDEKHGIKPEEKKTGHAPTPKRGALLEFDGKAQNICAWGEELGISPNTLYGRIYKMGWSIEKAFTTPARKK